MPRPYSGALAPASAGPPTLGAPSARGPVAVAPVSALHVAVRDLDEHVLAPAPAAGEVLDDRDRAVAPAGAADRDGEVRLALGDVLRQQEVEQWLERLVELLEAAVAADVLDDARVVARERPQRR